MGPRRSTDQKVSMKLLNGLAIEVRLRLARDLRKFMELS
jgi:hypothetical protein